MAQAQVRVRKGHMWLRNTFWPLCIIPEAKMCIIPEASGAF